MLTDDVEQFRCIGRTETVVNALRRYSELTRDGAVYDEYCIRYLSARNYMKDMKRHDEFNQFMSWCEQDSRCRRLLFTDLLLSPIQHYMRVPLVLSNIIRHTACPEEKLQLYSALTTLETSIKNLESKMNSIICDERMRQIHQQIKWPSVVELDPKAFVPEDIKRELHRQPCELNFFNGQRKLLHEGPATLIEISKKIDLYLFLFDDLLLLTRIKRPANSKKLSSTDCDDVSYELLAAPNTDGASFVVHRQPLALERICVRDVTISADNHSQNAAGSPRNSFVIISISQYEQIVAVYTLQLSSFAAKTEWLRWLTDACQTASALNNSDDPTAPPGESAANQTTAALAVTSRSQPQFGLHHNNNNYTEAADVTASDDVTAADDPEAAGPCRAGSLRLPEPPPRRRQHYERRYKTLSQSHDVESVVVDSVRL
jgi:hypothetical protein